MGVGDVPSVPSLALGSGEVTLQSLTAAYAAFANHGVVPRAVLIRRVEDRDGTVLFAAEEEGTRADQRRDRVPDVQHDGRRHQRGHRRAGAAASASRCRPRARPGRPTTTTTPGSSASRRRWSPASGSASISPRTILPGGFAADVAVPLWAAFMKVATKGQKAAVAAGAGRRRHGERLPHVGQARDRRVRARGRHRRDRPADCSDRWSTPSTSRAARSRPRVATFTHPAASSAPWPPCSPGR